VFQNVTIGQDQPQAQYVLTLSNDTGVSQAFKISTEDFGSLNQSGGVAFLGTSSSGYAQTYGLSKWMQLSQTAVTLAAGASTNIFVTITNSSSLATGGHYGAVLATALTAPNGAAAKSRIGVLEVLSSLLLLVKSGGPPPNLTLLAQTVDRQGILFPSQVQQLFKNQGDVHVVPRGTIDIRDPLGHLVARGAMNINSGIILPQTARRYDVSLMQLASAWMPGEYSVLTTYRYDGSNATKTWTGQFWYFGSPLLWLLVAAVLLLAAAIIWWFRRHPLRLRLRLRR